MITVNDLMTVLPYTVNSQTPLRQVIEIMKSLTCRQLPVLDNGRLVGIISDRDIRLVMNSPIVLHDRWQDEELLDKATAESCMTTDPMIVTPDTPAHLAADILLTYKFGALPVVDGKELVGIITVSDFLTYYSRQAPDVVDVVS